MAKTQRKSTKGVRARAKQPKTTKGVRTRAKAQPESSAEDMRAATKQGTGLAKESFVSFTGTAQEHATAATASATDLGQKVLTFTERNISATLQFGQRLMKAKDLSDVTRLRSEFLSAQTQALTEQVRELTQMASRTMMSGVPKSNA